jgi:hypothetical protein
MQCNRLYATEYDQRLSPARRARLPGKAGTTARCGVDAAGGVASLPSCTTDEHAARAASLEFIRMRASMRSGRRAAPHNCDGGDPGARARSEHVANLFAVIEAALNQSDAA